MKITKATAELDQYPEISVELFDEVLHIKQGKDTIVIRESELPGLISLLIQFDE